MHGQQNIKKLCTLYVGIFMSYFSNRFQIHNSNCSFVITVKHVLHYHCLIILISKRESLLITNCKNFFMIYYHTRVHCDTNTDFSTLIYRKVWLLVMAQESY